MMKFQSSPPLGQLLVAKKIITQRQLDQALAEQRQTGELLGVTLMRLGFVGEDAVYLPSLAQQLGVDFINLKETDIPREALQKVPAKFASYYKIIPVKLENDVLTVAMPNPLDIHVIDEIGLIAKTKLAAVLAGQKDIEEAIKKYYGVGAETIEQIMHTAGPRRPEPEITDIEQINSEASIGKFINQILLEAYQSRATDIHIEPFEDQLRIRYRIDGVLYEAKVPPGLRHFGEAINSRIKILSNLNIAEKRLPQDGRFKVRVKNIDLDLRVSFLPTPYGESVVIRILSSTKLLDLTQLGLDDRDQARLDELIQRPHGIIFVTGPTGSGKTTTLYSCLSRVNAEDRKIITIEDPIEYQLRGITQIQINPAIGLSFAAGLRSMLRHDPDIMMVGEVRDLETAEITIQVALTGHLVFSTIHTNDAASAVARLMDMGVEPYLIASSVQCFIAQRLVRILCPQCKKKTALNEQTARELGLSPQETANRIVYEPVGCEACQGTGFQGREGIYEFLVMSDAIRDLVTARVTAGQIKSAALKEGMRTLRQEGWEKVLKGITSPSEVIRVTQDEG